MPNDFFREIDLNPNPPASPVTSPDDPRAMFYFGFVSKGQEIRLLQGGIRVLVSFSYSNKAVSFSTGQFPQPDAILEWPSGVPDDPKSFIKYELDHERAHVLVWVDTSLGPPPINTPTPVRVRAWS